MNLTPMIAKELGVKIGEEFKISGYGKTKFVFRTCFQLADEDEEFEHSTDTVFTNLCLGVSELIKLPWKPKAGKIYFYLSGKQCNLCVHSSMWTNDLLDICLYKSGNCFRTEEEAEANKQAVWDRLTKGDKE